MLSTTCNLQITMKWEISNELKSTDIPLKSVHSFSKNCAQWESENTEHDYGLIRYPHEIYGGTEIINEGTTSYRLCLCLEFSLLCTFVLL